MESYQKSFFYLDKEQINRIFDLCLEIYEKDDEFDELEDLNKDLSVLGSIANCWISQKQEVLEFLKNFDFFCRKFNVQI